MKNLSIFEPQIEKHYAYKKTCTCIVVGIFCYHELLVFDYFQANLIGKFKPLFDRVLVQKLVAETVSENYF